MSPQPPSRSPAAVLCCCGGEEPALNVVRALGEQGVPVVVISEAEGAAPGRSRYCIEHHVTAPYSQDPQALGQLLQTLGDRFGVRLPVFPTADPDLYALAALEGRLGPQVVTTLGPGELVRTLMDKDAFRELAERHGLPVPATWSPRTQAEVAKIAAEARFPLIAKPAFPFNKHPALARTFRGRKGIPLADGSELVAVCAGLGDGELGVLLQTFIAGPDDHHYDVHAFIDRNGVPRAAFTGRKWRICPPHAGSGCYVESVHMPELERETLEMLQKIGFRGIANVNYKRDAATGEFFLFEVNARVSQWNIFTTRCGVNLPWLAYCDALGLSPGPLPPKRSGRYFVDFLADLRAMRQYAQLGEVSWARYLRSLLRPGLVLQAFSLRDLAPSLQLARERVREIVKARSSRALRPRVGTGSHEDPAV